MKNEIKTKKMTIRFISILVWFEVLWASVFIVGLVFQWSGLTNQLMTAFFASGFCALILIAALALLNFSANLNIIANAQMKNMQLSEVTDKKPIICKNNNNCWIVNRNSCRISLDCRMETVPDKASKSSLKN